MSRTFVTSSEIGPSIALSGSPTAPTPAAGDATTRIATTAFVGSAISTVRAIVYPVYTVAALPAAGVVGRVVYCSNCRVFSMLGTQQAAGGGTGSLVNDNGSGWYVVGTALVAAA